jgi:asparagine N-glycosylation enzyme membrane subunit Stt3
MYKTRILGAIVVIYLVILAVSMLLLSSAGSRVPVFIVLALMGSIPLAWGQGYMRLFGVIAVAVALMLAVWDYRAGRQLQDKLRTIRDKATHPTNGEK